MKKLAITISCISAIAGIAYGQGTVNWGGSAGNVIGETNSTSYFGGGATGTAGGSEGVTVGNTTTQYYYELLVSTTSSSAPTTISALSSWTDTGLEAENGTSNNGRLTELNSSTDAVANNWASGTTVSVILVGWSANLGTTWSAALSDLTSMQGWTGTAYFGVSSVGSLASQSGNPGVTVFGSSAGQISNPSSNPLVMSVVPEPASMALVALGGASLLLFRRKK